MQETGSAADDAGEVAEGKKRLAEGPGEPQAAQKRRRLGQWSAPSKPAKPYVARDPPAALGGLWKT